MAHINYIEIERTIEDLSRDYASADVLIRFEVPDFHRATLTCPGSEGPILDRVTYLDGTLFDGVMEDDDYLEAASYVIQMIEDQLEYADNDEDAYNNKRTNGETK
jgi:hypothetical protein